ncbi:MAG TPA: hypothetical protein VFS43_45090 [Polyangiaceae bacterium]|nr:hypothetical protein [Polyangiaceae bacterium]
MRKLGGFITLFFCLLATAGAGCAAPDGAGPEVTGESLGERQAEANVACPDKADICPDLCVANDRVWKGKRDPDDGACVCLPDLSGGGASGGGGSLLCYYTIVEHTSGHYDVIFNGCFPVY